MRMEQYIQMVDYSLWEVIENGNAPPITKLVECVETIIAPSTAEEKAQRRLELKARRTLFMGILNEHQLKFNNIKDAKSLLQAVEKRRDGLEVADGYANNEGKKILEEHWKKAYYEWAPRNQENRNIENTRSVPVETTTFNALISCDGNFMPPKHDFSFSGIKEFVNEPIVSKPTVKKHVVETSEAKASANKPKVVRKNNGAPIIKDYVFDSEEEDVPQAKKRRKQVNGKNVNNARPKAVVNAARPKAVLNVVKGNQVPRKNNMYSVDLKNIIPKRGLTCLFAKATSDESKLWHRRLGHINFKTMNKLVKGNLVRGLPLKLFENDQTCVACQKGKQHRASCTKHVMMRYARMEDSTWPKITFCYHCKPTDLPFSQNSKSSPDAGFKPSGDNEKKVTEEPGKEGGDPSNKNDSVNSTNNINTDSDGNNNNNVNNVSSPSFNTASLEVKLLVNDYKDVGAEDCHEQFSDTFMPVSPIPTTRIHKDHPV
ncbi:ribonuclease H-like domain-containing protein [Tanacetum coccineum]